MGFVPRAVKAKNEKALERQMLKVQLRHKSYIEWKSITFNSKDGNWYAWYVVDIDIDDAKKKETDEANQ
jgi:hypothetical protein